LNGRPLASGKAGGPNALTPVTASIPLNELNSDTSNLLRINRQDGNGRLYYRAFLQVNRPVESAPPVERGLSVSRSYYRADQDCRGSDCQPVSSIQMGNTRPLILARVTLNLPSDMYYLVVEDAIPAGAEILNTNLKTSQQGTPDVKGRVFDPSDPFSSGWGWWLFNSPQIFDQKIRWTAPYLPAGTYQLTYKLVPLISGEYRLLPAHAYQYYFPDVEGSSAGSVFKIQP
jgi:uncharacterized protein YfaS (alpha-2-macroglobulin family)